VADEDPRLATIRDITAGFDGHDLDRIMRHFTDDAVFEAPRGPDPWGRRVEGRDAVRDAFAARFSGIPDVHYSNDDHFVAGDRGASTWSLTGTTTDGQRIEVRGCDLWTFRDSKVVKKDSYWKIRHP
jgi:ketosteroid isomerase-like protein